MKSHSNLIDLKPFFEGIHDYVILKLSEDFPNYADHSDLDILCANPLAFLRHVLRQARPYEERGFRIQVSAENGHWHVDFYAPGETRLNFRFDLLESLVDFEKFSLSPVFEKSVLDGRRELTRNGVSVLVPQPRDDLAIRFLEYQAWGRERPEKVKHLRYIERFDDWSFIDVINQHTNLKVRLRKWWWGRPSIKVSQNSRRTTAKILANTKPSYPVSANCPIPHLDQIYGRFFEGTRTGRFVNVGAMEGCTSGLAKLGWKGLNVPAESAQLGDFLTQDGISPGFELLCLDVSGGKWNFLKSFDIENWRPRMVIVKLGAPLAAREPNFGPVRHFEDHGYTPVFKDLDHAVCVSDREFSRQRSRLDFFLIWGHGIEHTREIVGMIRSHENFQIVAIHKRKVEDIAKFVRQVYACDFVPVEHLIAKSKYLLQTPSEIALILARNRMPQEQFYGEGPFRHIQCQRVKEVKEEIRNRFNPRREGKRTEDHVIHASDGETQTEHVLEVLDLQPVSYFTRRPNLELEVPYHLPPFENYVLREVPVDDLRAKILGLGVVPLEQTPHYLYVLGQKESYESYHASHFGKELTDDHFPESFDRLIATFDSKRFATSRNRSFMIASRLPDGGYLLLDGVHRACILKYLQVKSVVIAEPVFEDSR